MLARSVLFLLLLFLSRSALAAGTFILTSDPLDPRASYTEVRIDGGVLPDCGATSPCISIDKTLEVDVTRFQASPFVAEVRVCGSISFECSGWSEPTRIDVSPLEVPTGIRVEIRVKVP